MITSDLCLSSCLFTAASLQTHPQRCLAALQVAFINGDRLIGDDAAALATKYPEKVISRARDLLGKPAADSSLRQSLKGSQLSYEVVAEPERETASVKVDSGDSLTAEELVVSAASGQIG